MKSKIFTLLAAAAAVSSASAAEGLYYVGSEAQESLPLKWTVGTNLTWDDNPTPTSGTIINPATGLPFKDDSVLSLGGYAGLSFVNISPQSTLDVYARVGAIYYFDKPAAQQDDWTPEVRVGVNWTRRFTERLRFSTRNFFAYEMEPNYAYGFATTRQTDPYLYWQTNNSIGYRWTERFATYTGFSITGLDYDNTVRNSDRLTLGLYQQFRYQLNPRSVLTFEYRYSQTEADGLAADSSSHYLLAGIEHRFSPNTILIARAGAQIRRSDAVFGSDGTNPFVELALRSQINSQFSVRAFARYSAEVYDTTRTVATLGGAGLYDFDDRRTLRLGISSEYSISPMFSLFGGIDYIPASFDDGRLVGVTAGAPALTAGGIDEDIWNAYVGVSVKFTDYLYGTLSYNYTDSTSDFIGYNYDRNRVSLGLRAEF
ncbi:hypothetical protein [Haloferula rosea]|uniref:Outer membrane beta-barrel protein n=1 Tax=Haloferula rosea TaxID=490093 RepID=A0A934VFP1_9BACT|nr:hypothetical protein [Haloferula rosea]MBK1828559.1 hypothetical protein [Haloferula rosea]